MTFAPAVLPECAMGTNIMTTRYTPTAMVLHWLMALLLTGTFVLGLYMSDLKLSPTKLQLYSYHKWIGITLLALAVFRVLWRLTHRPPAIVLPRWQQRASSSVHGMLYVLFIAIPLTGWLMSSAKGFQTVLFGVLPLPDLVGKDKSLGVLFTSVHENLNYLLLVLVLLHVAAALKHQLIDRDGLMARMLPGGIAK
ncbi:Cytochrome b/b6 domain [Gallionella capsiferriformans ES-2]|uniref:Cytochrome b/b6 domain n=2 Tax=Gallionella TaxID=96 RepID=D9SFW3_GALCS|nr:Cytochrome b/b6 domain [Gallionella capsiferriformans ES-2]